MKKWLWTSFAALAISDPVLAIIDATAPAPPCVWSRTVDAAIQTGIAAGCQEDLEITAAVCSDYLAQEILTAISYFCGNQTEAFSYCNSLPDVSIADCQDFDPSGGGVSPNCTQEALNAYNICGNSTGSDLFAAGDPVSLSQCLFFDLSLCTPEDGEGHFNTIFTGMPTDCPIPPYKPACGVYSTSTSAPTTTTAPPASPSSSSSSLSSAAPSFPTTEPSPPFSTVTTSTPVTAPTAPPNPPAGASPYFYLTINGTFTEFVGAEGGMIFDSTQAQVFYILNGQLFTINGLLIQADRGANPGEPYPYIPFIGSNGTLPFSTNFSLVTAGIEPSMKKRQAVGSTMLYWTNAAFTAPGTTADFCIYGYEVYAILQAGGLGADIYAVCVLVTLDAVYSKFALLLPVASKIEDCAADQHSGAVVGFPGSASTSSTAATPATTPATTPTTTSAMTAPTSISPTFSTLSCPIGQTLFAYTTVYS